MNFHYDLPYRRLTCPTDLGKRPSPTFGFLLSVSSFFAVFSLHFSLSLDLYPLLHQPFASNLGLTVFGSNV